MVDIQHSWNLTNKVALDVKPATDKKSQSLSTFINPLNPMSDQDRISPYNINTISIQYQPDKRWE